MKISLINYVDCINWHDATNSIDDDTNINGAQVIRELMQLGQYNKHLTSARNGFKTPSHTSVDQ